MWGTFFKDKIKADPSRFIPTRVGNTDFLNKIGEEQRHLTALSKSSTRFIPTRVGNTLKYPTLVSLNTVHPHGVGNTLADRTSERDNPVHPHACGEHKQPPEQCFLHHGSSPRVWGTQLVIPHFCCIIRFIPTRVGNTIIRANSVLSQSVHPHACGEHSKRALVSSLSFGSSPRVWGTRVWLKNPYSTRRFIPTRVGNTPSFPICLFPFPVHPHACGEHSNVQHIENK